MDSSSESYFPITSGIVDVGNQVLHFLKIGSGSKLVLAFNGYGNDASVFQFLQHDNFTVLSFDLPYHGNSIGNNDSVLTKVQIETLVHKMMSEYQVQKFGLVGFSLGARLCLCITEVMPEHIRNMVLVAPDGLRPNYLFQFLTSTQIGNYLFSSFVQRGDAYLRFFAKLHQIGIIDRYRYKFALQYIHSLSSRKLLYNIWMSTRALTPRLQHLKKVLATHHIPIHILMGQQDKIIPLKNAMRFKSHNDYIFVHVFERGHNLLAFEEVRGTVAAWLFRTNQQKA
ncbi:MAG: alpha/beta hydrolase [Phycisphaerales bacterium]|nr:alpha/beta hydrolase [Phycisphaerales bacterium]